jgi:radical SAM superfamily enzyme YgiQ (UPF0313 family)
VSVYLADLRYDSGVLANDTFPLGIGYMKAVMDRDLPEVQSRLFAYPDKLWDAIVETPPDVLMLSNYIWNERLSLHIARLAKRVKPDMLTVMGGPNIHLEPERQLAWFGQQPELDVYVLGEGDFLATEIVRQFLQAGLSVPRMTETTLPSSLYRRANGSIVRNETWDRREQIDEVPSPFTSGILDEFFDGRLTPLLETNRGCPFGCTFCCQGTNWYTKVRYFAKERLREEIHYVGRRVRQVCPSVTALRIADSNYGMFERDAEISGYIGEAQQLYGWPTYIDATTGKNRPDRIIRSLERVNGAMVLYQAVQSLDETVLRNVKRQTIKLEAYEALQVHMRGRGLRSNSDLILGLPGETLESHRSSLRRLLDSGISQVTNFQLMMLKGTELEMEATRREFQFRSMWRALPKNFGVYGGEKVFDIEEIVVETDTLSFDDYLEARTIALASVAFWHDNYFEDVISFAESLGMRRSNWLDIVLEAMRQHGGSVRKFLDDFLRETTNELFPSRQACLSFYSQDENFELLRQGVVGENLMHKYHAIASFRIWPSICASAMNATKELITRLPAAEDIPDFEEFWTNLEQFVRLRHAWGLDAKQILAPEEAEMTYDIAAWLAAGQPKDPSPFRFSEPLPVRFELTPESKRELASALEVWTDDIRGLSKLVTRVRVASQVRTASVAMPKSFAAASGSSRALVTEEET